MIRHHPGAGRAPIRCRFSFQFSLATSSGHSSRRSVGGHVSVGVGVGVGVSVSGARVRLSVVEVEEVFDVLEQRMGVCVRLHQR